MKLAHGLGLGVFGLCTGLAVAYGGFKTDIAKIISMLGVGAFPASFITYLVTDSKSQKLLNDAESKNIKAGETLTKVIREFDNCKKKLTAIYSQLETVKDELKEARNTINSLGHAKIENSVMIAHLNSQLDEYQSQLTQLSTHSYNENLDDVGEAIAHERQNYLLQIELLNERVGQLQQQLQGDLVEPVYGDFGFDVNGKITNEIARTLFRDLQKINYSINKNDNHFKGG